MKTCRPLNRNFILLISGQATSLLGNFTLKFALSMYVLEQTGSASVFAGILAAATLPTILLSPFGGILADRANRRNIMVALDLLSGLAVLFTVLLLPLGKDIPIVTALLIILSVLAAFESPTVQACIPQMLSGDALLKGNAAVNQVAAIASLVTPFLGSLFYTAFGLRPVLSAAAACFFVTAFFECFIRLDNCKPTEHIRFRTLVKEDFSASIHFLCREQPGILKLLLLAALVSLFVAGVAVVGFPYLVRTVLALPAAYYGAAESIFGAAAISGSLYVGLSARKLRMKHLSAILSIFGICLIPAGIVFLLPISAYSRYFVLLAMFFVCQAGCSAFSACALSAIQSRTPAHLMGKVMAYVFTLSMCAQPLGQLLYGVLFDRLSDYVYWVLIPTGILVCMIGAASAGFFSGLEQTQPSSPGQD